MRLFPVLILATTGLLLLRCETSNVGGAPADAISVLEATRTKMLANPTHQYTVAMHWDNRFASSTNRDTVAITYSKLAGSQLGFGLHVVEKNEELLYDGKDRLDIDHVRRKVVRTTAAEIGQQTNYLDNLTFFHNDPKDLPEQEDLSSITDTIRNGKQEYVFATTRFNPTTYDASKEVSTTRQYFIDPEQRTITRIRKSTHVENDTIQVIDYFFDDFTFSDTPFDFGVLDRPAPADYRELTDTENDEERLAGLVKPGQQLHRSDYTDINNEEQLLYGRAGKKTVVMFSYVGCGGCEYALREMKQKEFAVKEGIALVYSSPLDEAPALQAYLKKKAFPFTGFGKRSLMNENFKVAAFPTFVLINEAGVVERVIGGYDQEIAGILF